MLWLFLIVGAIIAAFAVPRVGKVIVRVLALLVAIVILVPLGLIVAVQRARVRRRRRLRASGNQQSRWPMAGAAQPEAVPTRAPVEFATSRADTHLAS